MALKPKFGKKINSLLSLCVVNLVKNIPIYDLETIKILPAHIKNRILRKLITQPKYCDNLNFNTILEVIIYPSLKTINLTFIGINNETLNILRKCSYLKEIRIRQLENNRITSDGFTNLLENTPNLSVLDVTKCQAFNDDVLEFLSMHCSKITTIYADSCDVSDKGLISLSKHIRTLTHLIISNTKVTNKGVSYLVQTNRNFRELRMDNCPNINDDILKMIAKNCPKVEILTFLNSPINVETLSLFEDSNKHLKQIFWSVSW